MAEPQRRNSGLGIDVGTSGGEWLFKRGDQVFGPVPAKVLIDLLYKGEVDGDTRVSPDGGAYQRLAEVPFFIVHVKKAEAQIRVQREVTGVRKVEQRRNVAKGTGALVVAALLLGGGGFGAYWLAINKPWQKKSALLEDFGDGIVIASAARIGGKHSHGAAAPDEVEVPAEAPLPGKPAARRGSKRSPGAAPTPSPGPAPGGNAQGGDDLTVAQYDQGNIQAVIGREQRTLAPCLKSEARRSPDFNGEIPIEFAIANNGKVAELWIDQARFKRGELHDCLLRTLQSWSFKPFPGERPTVSLTFRIGK